VRGDVGAHAILILPRQRDVDKRGHEHVAAQGMQPERDDGAGPEGLVQLLDGD